MVGVDLFFFVFLVFTLVFDTFWASLLWFLWFFWISLGFLCFSCLDGRFCLYVQHKCTLSLIRNPYGNEPGRSGMSQAWFSMGFNKESFRK